MFRDREDAGEKLAELLKDHDVYPDVVLAIPRGALPIGRVVADKLGARLDIVVARKIGAPGNPELAIGAVSSVGITWLNESMISDMDISDDYIEREKQKEMKAARDKLDRYKAGRDPLELEGKTVLIVDDGIATGATMTACVREVRDRGASRVIIAAPVAAPETAERLMNEADQVICVETPTYFGAVGQFYEVFTQVSDEEAKKYLE